MLLLKAIKMKKLMLTFFLEKTLLIFAVNRDILLKKTSPEV